MMPTRTSKKASPTRAGKAKPAKSMPRTKPIQRKAPKAVRKAPKAAKKAKSAKRPAAKRSSPKPVKHDAAHERHMAEIRQQVARRRPGMAPLSPHMHEQQDPSIVAPPPPPPAPVDRLHNNYGDDKNKAVTRFDKPTNWFRQAPKPKSK